MSVISSLRKANFTAYRHNRSQDIRIPEITPSQKDDLAHVSLQDLELKVRKGYKVLGSVSVGGIEGTINSQELDSLVAGVNHWLEPINQLSSAMDTISARRLCKSRNLIASIVLAGDQNYISNDPPYLTRPSHVLRISKNLLRVNDTWKIASRVRHIMRSLPPEVKADLERKFLSSTACTLDSMEPVYQILSRWRSWEMSNIQDSYFFHWLSGNVDAHPTMMASIPIEGVLSLDTIRLRYDVRDGKDNVVVVRKLIVNCAETPEPTAEIKATNVIGVDFSCQRISVRAASDVLDLFKSLDRLQSVYKPPVPTPDEVNPPTEPPLMIEYRGTVLINQFDISAIVAALGLSISTRDLRVSAFSQLRRTEEYESPSLNMAFRRLEIAALEKRDTAASVRLENFASQMVTLNQRPGLAASLGSVAVRLVKPIPWLVMRASETIRALQTELGIPDDMVDGPEPIPISKPNLPTVTFRLNQASIESWLVPDAVLIHLSSKGIQTVLGELQENSQWIFLDMPPATVSIHRTTGDKTKLAELTTPFIAVKAAMRWYEDLCRLDPDVHIGTLALRLTDLATFFATLATEQVTAHLDECKDAFEEARKLLAPPAPAEDHHVSETQPLPVSYRLRSKWESFQIIADTPDCKILFTCSDIHISLSNRSHNAGPLEGVYFTAGSRNTSLSLIFPDAEKDMKTILDTHWEVGNSFSSDEHGGSLYRLYFTSDSFGVTLSPQSISKGSRALQYVFEEVEKLQIAKTLKELNIGSKRPRHEELEIHSAEDLDPLRSLHNFDAVRVSLSHITFNWIANDYLDDSHGFTFKCSTVNASVLDRATRARFMVQDAELKLNVRKTLVSSNYARLPKLDFNVHRRTEEDGWQLQLDAHGDTVQVNITPACIESGHAVLESISSTAGELRTEFPPDESAPPTRPSTSHSLLEQTKKLKAVVTTVNFSGATINAQYDTGFQPTAYMSKYRVEGDGCEVGSMQIPGLALRSRFARRPRHVFHAEICILESRNTLSPQIKPFLHDILHSIERVMSHRAPTFNEPAIIPAPDSVPSTAAILGDLKFSVGLRVQSQELTLTCDPFSKVDAKVGVKEIYATLISCKTASHNQTFAMTVTVSGAHASLQHQYSGIASANIKLNDLNLSMFNNYQIRSSEPGISAILKSSAFEVSLNARQGPPTNRAMLIGRPRFPYFQQFMAGRRPRRPRRRTPSKTPLEPTLNATTPKSHRFTALLPAQRHRRRRKDQIRIRPRPEHRNDRP